MPSSSSSAAAAMMCCGSSPRRAAALAAQAAGGGFDEPPARMATKAEQLPPSALEERYEMHELCGSGKFAEVRRARRRSAEGARPEEFALKFIDKRVAHSDQSNVEREVDIALSLEHPNVVRSFHALETPQHVVLCMQLVDGLDAFEHYSAQADRLGPARVTPEKEVAGHCLDVLQALQYLHARGIAHRDLKLENIMITTGGRAVVVDFGCAGRVSSGESGGGGGGGGVMKTMCGTLEYAAPELLLSEPYGVACDIWSLGVVAFILLSGGDRPFWDGNQKKLIRMVSDGSGKHKHSYRDASWTKRSLTCRGFIDSCLTKDPDQRPSAASLLANAWMQLASRGEDVPAVATPVAEAEPPQSHDKEALASSHADSAAETTPAEGDAVTKALQARRRFRLAGHTIGAVVRWRSFTETVSVRRELVDTSA
jgi:serine/threonine protein kinase